MEDGSGERGNIHGGPSRFLRNSTSEQSLSPLGGYCSAGGDGGCQSGCLLTSCQSTEEVGNLGADMMIVSVRLKDSADDAEERTPQDGGLSKTSDSAMQERSGKTAHIW